MYSKVRMSKPDYETATPVDVAAGYSKQPQDTPQARKKAAKLGAKLRGKTILPKPPAAKTTPEKFFAWIDGFNEEQRGKAQVHAYREWPVINKELIGEHRPKLLKEFQEDFPFTALNCEEFFLSQPEWGGSGKYKLMVTEMGVPGMISMTRFSLEDEAYPPLVDPNILVAGHPDNAGYISGLRAKGKRLPFDDPAGQAAEKAQEEEMSVAAAAVQSLAENNERLTEKNMELLDKLGDRNDETKEPPNTMVQDATLKILDVGLGMVSKQVDAMSRESAKSFNPIEMLNSAVGLAEKLKSNDSAGIQYIELAKTMMDSQSKMHDVLLANAREEKEFWRERAIKASEQPAPVVNPNGIDSAMAEMEKVKRFAELMGFSRRNREPEREEPAEPSLLKTLGKSIAENPAILTTGLGLLNSIFYNAVVMFKGGEPKSTENVLREAQQPQPAVAQPQTNARPALTKEQNDQMFVDWIEKSFLAHFHDPNQMGLDGYSFAALLQRMLIDGGAVTNEGMTLYNSMRQEGMQSFDQLIRKSHLWSQLQAFSLPNTNEPKKKPKYVQFLEEIFTYPEWVQLQQSQAN